MDIYHHKKRALFSGPHLLGMLFILAGAFSLISPYIIENTEADRSLYIGIGGISFGLMVVSAYGGTLIDFKKRRVKQYSSFLGYKFGNWAELPEIASVRLVTDRYEATNIANGISPTLSGEVTDYVVFLCNPAGEPELTMVYTREEKAIRDVRTIAEQFNTQPEFLMTT
ncbi:MAG: hypothetical protein Roseis2KO_60210 [Roseivirga sp.]